MNAVEIEAAISDLAEASFDASEFSYTFLSAFGHKAPALRGMPVVAAPVTVEPIEQAPGCNHITHVPETAGSLSILTAILSHGHYPDHLPSHLCRL